MYIIEYFFSSTNTLPRLFRVLSCRLYARPLQGQCWPQPDKRLSKSSIFDSNRIEWIAASQSSCSRTRLPVPLLMWVQPVKLFRHIVSGRSYHNLEKNEHSTTVTTMERIQISQWYRRHTTDWRGAVFCCVFDLFEIDVWVLSRQWQRSLFCIMRVLAKSTSLECCGASCGQVSKIWQLILRVAMWG